MSKQNKYDSYRILKCPNHEEYQECTNYSNHSGKGIHKCRLCGKELTYESYIRAMNDRKRGSEWKNEQQ